MKYRWLLCVLWGLNASRFCIYGVLKRSCRCPRCWSGSVQSQYSMFSHSPVLWAPAWINNQMRHFKLKFVIKNRLCETRAHREATEMHALAQSMRRFYDDAFGARERRGEESAGETVLCCHPPDAAAMNPAHRAPVCHSMMSEVLKHPRKTSIAMSERDCRRGLPRIRRSTVMCQE